eukprot:90709_1
MISIIHAIYGTIMVVLCTYIFDWIRGMNDTNSFKYGACTFVATTHEHLTITPTIKTTSFPTICIVHGYNTTRTIKTTTSPDEYVMKCLSNGQQKWQHTRCTV